MKHNYHQTNASQQRGFTIIELLIVIVVIGILATLTFVTFKNIKGQAQAAVARNVVQQYSKALAGYKAEHDEYPIIESLTDMGMAAGPCLGTGYTAGDCGTNFGTGKESPQFNALMKPYVGNTPDIRPHTTSYHFDSLDITITGIVLQHVNGSDSTLDGQPADFYAITYALDEPDTQCVGGQVLRVGSIPGTNYITGSFKNTITDSKNTACFLKLPD